MGELVNWDSQIDDCLLNAHAVLAHCPEPQEADDFHPIVFAWLALADAWMRRQINESEFEAWRSGKETEELDMIVEFEA